MVFCVRWVTWPMERRDGSSSRRYPRRETPTMR